MLGLGKRASARLSALCMEYVSKSGNGGGFSGTAQTAKAFCQEVSQPSYKAFGTFTSLLPGSARCVAKNCVGGEARMLLGRAKEPWKMGLGWLVRWKSAQATAIPNTNASKALAASYLSEGLSDSARKQLVAWLGVCSGWVFSLVVIGGMTRLTRSGLSMTDWKFTGERPPSSEQDWQMEFEKYRQSPEWKRMNQGMTLDEFKFIYWMEYGHRMWGRVLGLVFAVPGSYFLARGMITKRLGQRLGLLFLMGGTQGLVGWWMVKSGLQDPEDQYAVPRVSPYRLATHLTSAFTIYALLAWTTLSLAYPQPNLASVTTEMQKGGAVLRGRLVPLCALIGLTAFSGAFVAGLDAGHAYNTFPTMNGEWFPSQYWDIPGVRNFFENTAAVQFDHRMLAYTTLASVTAFYLASRKLPLPRSTQRLTTGVMHMTGLQVALGITTLLTYVPVSLGSLHQAGALTLFTLSLGLLHSVRAPEMTKMGQIAARFGTPVAAALVLMAGGALISAN